jgi:inner membrane transporter RhtA
MLMTGAVLIQCSVVIVKPAMAVTGAASASGWRFLLGAVVLLALVRPPVRSWTRRQWMGAINLGIASAVMNQSFYQAVNRIHLGTAVAIEYMGPFAVAALGKRSWRHAAMVLLALVGVLLLARPGGGLNAWGIFFAAGSGVGWAWYAFASHQVGKDAQGFQGLAVSMSIGAVVTLPMAMSHVSDVASSGSVFLRLLLVAVMSTVLGFGSEMQALRRLSPVTVSVLLALDPAVAFLVGLLFLHEGVVLFDILGMIAVVTAGIVVTMDAEKLPPEPLLG